MLNVNLTLGHFLVEAQLLQKLFDSFIDVFLQSIVLLMLFNVERYITIGIQRVPSGSSKEGTAGRGSGVSRRSK